MTRDRAHLQRWYRQAMGGRAEELRGLRKGISDGDGAAAEDVRRVAMALRGSGASFGFPHVTEVATLLETSRDEDLLRRMEGLIAELDALSASDDGATSSRVPEWLARAAGVQEAASLGAVDGLTEAWAEVARRVGSDRTELAGRVADAFGLEIADLAGRSSAALRLVPEALVISDRVVPLREDAETITVATADPTALTTERQLEEVTGRRPVFVVAPPEVIDVLIDEMRTPAPPRRTPELPDLAPASAEALEAGEAGGEESAADGAVLVVDDEPSARLLVRTLLERQGYLVIEAEDGVDALKAVGDGSGIGLVVADLNMPRMDGLELIWELRDAHSAARLPVIVVTGEADEILETQLMEEGADDYIRKPIDPRLFLARVEATVRRLGARVTRIESEPENG